MYLIIILLVSLDELTQVTTILSFRYPPAKEFPTRASWDVVAYAHNFTLKVFPAFLRGLEARGWVTSRNHLGPDEWRANWNLVEPYYEIGITKRL
jgi:hypothetical protein